MSRARASKGRDQRSAHAKLTVLAFGLVIAGALAFELVPKALDLVDRSAATLNAFFFVAAASVFLNSHHYCVGATIWRMRDPRVRDVLFFRSTA